METQDISRSCGGFITYSTKLYKRGQLFHYGSISMGLVWDGALDIQFNLNKSNFLYFKHSSILSVVSSDLYCVWIEDTVLPMNTDHSTRTILCYIYIRVLFSSLVDAIGQGFIIFYFCHGTEMAQRKLCRELDGSLIE